MRAAGFIDDYPFGSAYIDEGVKNSLTQQCSLRLRRRPSRTDERRNEHDTDATEEKKAHATAGCLESEAAALDAPLAVPDFKKVRRSSRQRE